MDKFTIEVIATNFDFINILTGKWFIGVKFGHFRFQKNWKVRFILGNSVRRNSGVPGSDAIKLSF